MSRTVLVVEDNPVTRKLLRVTLEGGGYDVAEAADGKAALEQAQTRELALIVQDLKLPDMDGFDLIKQLRAMSSPAAQVPILCYSGLIGPEDREQVLAAGFTDLVLKPATPAELLKTVHTYLTAAPGADTAILAGRHILLVDDEPAQRKLSALRLTAAGARVTDAVNGHDALVQARAAPPDAILSDVLMPECDGFALCAAVRADPVLAGVPLVLMSSQYVDAADRALAQKLGANALVVRSPDLAPALTALVDSLAGPAPVAEAGDLHGAHLDRVVHRLERLAGAQTQLLQTQSLYGILAGFLAQVTQAQSHGATLANRFDEMLLHYLDACGYPTGALYLFEAGGEIVLRALSGVPTQEADAWLDFFHRPALLTSALTAGAPTVWSATAADRRDLLHAAGANTMVLCPLQAGDQPLGVMVLSSQRQHVDDEWLALLQAVAGPISQAIAFARTLMALTASEQRFRHVAESLADGLVIADEHGHIAYANPAVERMFGHPAGTLPGQECAHALPLLVPRAGVWTGQMQHRDGHPVPVNGSTSLMLDPEHPERLTYTHVIHDLSTQEHMEQFRHLANHDLLTGVANRRYFEDALAARLHEAERHHVHGALLMLDLDHFKLINDSLGHTAGDAALVAFAEILRGAIRETDVLARLGGDEFGILVPHADAAQAEALAAKLLQRLAGQPLTYRGQTVRLGASIGIALYPAHGATPAALFASADRALYQAKQAGRGRYRTHSPDTAPVAAQS